MLQAVAMGIGGGFVMVVFFSFWGRAYGPRHLGRIQGGGAGDDRARLRDRSAAAGSFVDATGSYVAAFYSLAVAVALLGLAAAVVPMPAGVESSGQLSA